MKKFQINPLILFSAFFIFSEISQAQMYGTGMQMGMMGCPYQQAIGDSAEDKIDDINEAKEDLSELKSKISEEKSKKREIEGKIKRAKEALAKRAFNENYLNFLIAHIDEIKSCEQYNLPPRELQQAPAANPQPAQPQQQPSQPGKGTTDNSEISQTRMPASDTSATKGGTVAPATTVTGNGKLDTKPFSIEAWDRVCERAQSGKIVVSEACSVTAARIDKNFQSDICLSKLKEYQDEKQKLKDIEAKIATMEANADLLKAKISDLKGEIKTAIREYQREQRREATEGGCVECMVSGSGSYVSSKPDWGGVITNTVLGLGSIMLGNQMQKYVSTQNARIGYPTQTYPSFGYGFPFIMGALSAGMGGRGYYGSINGGMGQGGFGCAGGNGMMGGAFGYPPGMFQTPFGGGLFTGYPMGAMVGGMGGAMMGYPMGMMAGGFGGAMMGYPMGMMAGGMGGMMMGYPMGMMAGGMGGAMMGMPMGNMMGMMAGGMGGAMMGMPMGNMMGFDSSGMMNMQMQMQQQAMQMQQQQMQLYYQQQSRAQENYMNGTRVIVGLQQEMQSVQMRLQQAMMSLNSGGYLGFQGSAGFSLGTQMGTPGVPMGTPGTVVPTPGASPGVPSTR